MDFRYNGSAWWTCWQSVEQTDGCKDDGLVGHVTVATSRRATSTRCFGGAVEFMTPEKVLPMPQQFLLRNIILFWTTKNMYFVSGNIVGKNFFYLDRTIFLCKKDDDTYVCSYQWISIGWAKATISLESRPDSNVSNNFILCHYRMIEL